MTTVTKHCARRRCGKAFTRRRTENSPDFAARRFCSGPCRLADAREKSWAARDRASGRPRGKCSDKADDIEVDSIVDSEEMSA